MVVFIFWLVLCNVGFLFSDYYLLLYFNSLNFFILWDENMHLSPPNPASMLSNMAKETFADGINSKILNWEDCPRWSGWGQCTHRGLHDWQQRQCQSEWRCSKGTGCWSDTFIDDWAGARDSAGSLWKLGGANMDSTWEPPGRTSPGHILIWGLHTYIGLLNSKSVTCLYLQIGF